MKVEFLSAVLLASTNHDRLAAFYRDVIGVPLEEEEHGPSVPSVRASHRPRVCAVENASRLDRVVPNPVCEPWPRAGWPGGRGGALLS
jgi:hypothetical protein